MQTDIAALIIQSVLDAIPKFIGAFWDALWVNPWAGATVLGVLGITAMSKLGRRPRRVR